MEKKNENPKIEELTDEQMKQVAGGGLPSSQECHQMQEDCKAKSDCWEQYDCINNLKQQYGCFVYVEKCDF